MVAIILTIISIIIAGYLALLGIFVCGVYNHARYKIEQSFKPFRRVATEFPTKEQLRLLKEEVNKADSPFNKERMDIFKSNIKYYERISKFLNFYTFNIFKHFE